MKDSDEAGVEQERVKWKLLFCLQWCGADKSKCSGYAGGKIDEFDILQTKPLF
jgi:hypothetical protein